MGAGVERALSWGPGGAHSGPLAPTAQGSTPDLNPTPQAAQVAPALLCQFLSLLQLGPEGKPFGASKSSHFLDAQMDE